MKPIGFWYMLMILVSGNINSTNRSMETLLEVGTECKLEVNAEKTMYCKSHYLNAGENHNLKTDNVELV